MCERNASDIATDIATDEESIAIAAVMVVQSRVYTCLSSQLEDLLKQIAKAFENHIDNLTSYHKELLIRLNTEIPGIRPSVLSKENYLLLDKIRAFRHFICHAYDCELDENELSSIQRLINNQFKNLEYDFHQFRKFIEELLIKT